MNDDLNERYSRQIMLPEIGKVGQYKLKKARVLIVGVGGLGSPIALYLTGAGVGVIGIIDDDVVSINNLQRQVLYEEKQIGEPKVFCAKKRLLSINSEITVNAYNERLTEENVMKIITDYDIIVDGTDNYDVRYIISDACQELKKPYIYGAICGFEGQVAILCYGNATYRTLFPEQMNTHSGKQVIGFTPAIVGSLQASQVIQLICGYGEPLIDRLWTIDLRTIQSFIINL